MLMNLILMRGGFPPALIKKDDRMEYYDTLKQADPLHGDDIRPFVHFVTRCLERSIDEYKKQMETVEASDEIKT
jgi:Fic family protein